MKKSSWNFLILLVDFKVYLEKSVIFFLISKKLFDHVIQHENEPYVENMTHIIWATYALR